jgi:CheY-like chemotaxis protein
MVEISWKESNGPPINSDRKSGFGEFLITQGIRHQLSGDTTVDYGPNGLNITLRFPMRAASSADIDELQESSAPPPSTFQGSMIEALENVLVLEDSFLIAAETKAALTKFGIGTVTLAATNEQAIEEIDKARPDFAIVDLNLGNQDSYATVCHLRDKDVPFLFLSGYSDDFDWIKTFPNSLLVNKPIRDEALLSGVIQTLAWVKVK